MVPRIWVGPIQPFPNKPRAMQEGRKLYIMSEVTNDWSLSYRALKAIK